MTIARILAATALIAVALLIGPHTQGRGSVFAFCILFAVSFASIGVLFRGKNGAVSGAALGGCIVPSAMIAVLIILLYVANLILILSGGQLRLLP